MGLSLQELILLLEIAPTGWTSEEAIGLVRRIAREICAKSVANGEILIKEEARWQRLSTADEEALQADLCPNHATDGKVSGDRILAAAITLLKHDLAALRGA